MISKDEALLQVARQSRFLIDRVERLEHELREKKDLLEFKIEKALPKKGVDYFDGADAPDPVPIINWRLQELLPGVVKEAAALIPKPKDGQDAPDPTAIFEKKYDESVQKLDQKMVENLPKIAAKAIALVPLHVFDERIDARMPEIAGLASSLIGKPEPGKPGKDGVDAVIKRHRGDWSRDVEYLQGDMVFTSGSSYLALKKNINQDPWNTQGIWQIIASGGRNTLFGSDSSGGGGGSGTAQSDYEAFTPSTSGDSTFTIGAEVVSHVVLVTASAGAGSYTRNFVLPTMTSAGRQALVRIEIASSGNPILKFYSLSTGGNLLFTATGLAGTATSIAATFVFNGTNWILFQATYDE